MSSLEKLLEHGLTACQIKHGLTRNVVVDLVSRNDVENRLRNISVVLVLNSSW